MSLAFDKSIILINLIHKVARSNPIYTFIKELYISKHDECLQGIALNK